MIEFKSSFGTKRTYFKFLKNTKYSQLKLVAHPIAIGSFLNPNSVITKELKKTETAYG